MADDNNNDLMAPNIMTNSGLQWLIMVVVWFIIWLVDIPLPKQLSTWRVHKWRAATAEP